MKPKYIDDFEHLGMGLFAHFGLYSLIKKGEWIYVHLDDEEKKNYPNLLKKFNISKTWAKDLVSTAKKAGAKYITLTTRHHDGFSLYDTCGLNEYDAPHSLCNRDLIREFVDECNKEKIIPFFYHTLLDWWHPDFEKDFPSYLIYLRKSIEILCKNYGKIGGFWFDGSWSKFDITVWEFDKLYSLIRSYQPNAMIINNTGLVGEGEISHEEIDSVTFERGKPFKVITKGKDIAGEMCDGITDHWGYCERDFCVKPYSYLLKSLIDCRFNDCNYLINTGLLNNGRVNLKEKLTLIDLGKWIKINKNFIYNIRSADIKADNALVVKDDKYYYAISFNVPMAANENVTVLNDGKIVTLKTKKKITNPIWLDDKHKKVEIVNKEKNKYRILAFEYGKSYFSRVMRFTLK